MKFKTFTAEALVAAEMNDLIMRQVIIQVDNNTERDSIPAPEEGMVCYVISAHRLEYFNGAAWKSLDQSLPYVEYRRASPASLVTGVSTLIDVDATPVSVSGVWSESAGVITVPESGFISATVSALYEAGGAATVYQVAISKNGTTDNVLLYQVPPALGRACVVTGAFRVEAGDTLRLWAYQNAGATKTFGELGPSPILTLRYERRL